VKAVWKNVILAESSETVVVEGTHYFPPGSVKREYLRESHTHTACPWKGVASYYNIDVDGEVNRDAAWYYPEPSAAAQKIRGHVAFWKGVEVIL
jgi:uncharacterized protein (DUF427 family)